MARDFVLACVILVASSAVGLASNYLRQNPLTLIRKDVPLRPADPVRPNGRREVSPTASRPTGTTDQPGAGGPSDASKDGEATLEQVAAHLTAGTAFFIDAREPNEYAEGHFRGAINAPSSAIFENADAVTSMVGIDQPVIIYCGGGECEASHNVADALVRYYGYTSVSIYTKGWEEASASEALADYIVRREDQP
jgi:3-mercaptopyruvate sulfurtransferase SseA